MIDAQKELTEKFEKWWNKEEPFAKLGMVLGKEKEICELAFWAGATSGLEVADEVRSEVINEQSKT